MNRRSGPIAMFLTSCCLAATVVACGSDAPATSPPTDPTPPTESVELPGTDVPSTEVPTTAADDPVSHPTDPDVALLRLGGPDEMPSMVIGGDGSVYTIDIDRPVGRVAMVPLALPPPQAPTSVSRQQLTDLGLQRLLQRARELGLLQAPAKDDPPGVTDMGSTTLLLADADGTYEHSAYALGFDTETGARRRLQQFIAQLGDLPALVGASEISRREAYHPSKFTVHVGGFVPSDAPSWPAGLLAVDGCLDGEEIGDLTPDVVGAYAQTDDAGTTTGILVFPDLPGDDC